MFLEILFSSIALTVLFCLIVMPLLMLPDIMNKLRNSKWITQQKKMNKLMEEDDGDDEEDCGTKHLSR